MIGCTVPLVMMICVEAPVMTIYLVMMETTFFSVQSAMTRFPAGRA